MVAGVVGLMVGSFVGASESDNDGNSDGIIEGISEGIRDAYVGSMEGVPQGDLEKSTGDGMEDTEGTMLGEREAAILGSWVMEGAMLGKGDVGWIVTAIAGASVIVSSSIGPRIFTVVTVVSPFAVNVKVRVDTSPASLKVVLI